MLKKRLIFTLLVSDSDFQLSRNFALQKVGNLAWLYDCYNLDAIFKSIDELVILNVSRDPVANQEKFLNVVQKLAKNCFVPIALGGGIRTSEDAYKYMDRGADKLVLGQATFNNAPLVKELVSIFGGQSMTAAIDFLRKNQNRQVMIENGQKDSGFTLEKSLEIVRSLGFGELMLTSIEKDGTGQGYDMEAYEIASKILNIPIIASGGVGKFVHLADSLQQPFISAANTANIFNFMMNGLIDARKSIEDSGIKLAHWNME
jgi:cyclase